MTDQFEVQRFARDFARRLAKLERSQRRTAASPNTLNHAAIDGGDLVVKDDQGQVKYHLGTDPVTGVTAPKFEPGPVPAQPEAPDLEAREGAVHVELSGLDVDEHPAPADLRHAEIHMSLDEGFEVTPGTMVTSTPNPADGVSISKASGMWWVRVVWVTLSGQRSEPSEAVSVDIVPPVDAQDLQDTLDAAQEALDEYRDNVATPRFQALETGLSESNDNLADARTRLSAAEQTLSPLPGRIESAEQDVAAAQVEATKAAAAAVEANNRAMTRLANGNFESDLLYWDHHNVSLTSTAHSGQQAAQIGGWLRPGSSFPVVPDQIWELSLYYQYDVTVVFETVDGDQRATLSTHHLDGDSTWSDSGALRVTIPADVHMLSFTITGTSAIVDDITLRDVTDVVRLEEAANANRQKAEQAISELAVMRLAVDGAGGLKDRLDSAEDDLENIDTELDQVATNLTAALTGPITHDRLRSGTGAFDQGFIGELWAGNIRALAAELASLIVASPNMIPNGDLTQGDDFWTLSNAQLVTDDTPPGYEHAIRRAPNDGSVSHNVRFPVQGGEEYLWEMWIKADKPGSSFYWDMRDQDGNHIGHSDHGGSTENLEPEWYPHSSKWRPVSDLKVPTEWTRVRTVLRPGDHVVSLRMAATYFNHANGTERDATVSIGGLRMTPRAGAEVLVDGSVTAEKIHATRELITKIMGAEWAYIAQQLIVDGSILTRDLEALSAAIQSLTVTQRADIAELWAEELWTALAVIEELQAEEAWITSAMIQELTAEKVTVTENFVGRVAELLHLVVDRIDANALWADQTWQNAGYFGSEDSDYTTRMDGQGLSVWRQVEGEQQLATRLGPGENALSFFDEDTGQLTGSLSQDGSANLQETAVQSLSIAGRDLTHAPNEYQPGVPLLDSMPRGVWVAGPIDMSGVSVDRSRYGFLELTADVVEGRVYRLSTNNFLMGTDKSYQGVIWYTLDPQGIQVPTVNSPELLRWIINAPTPGNVQEGGRTMFVAPETGVLKLLLGVRTANAATVGISFNSLSTWAGDVQLWLEDLGTNKDTIYRRRFSQTGGSDPDFLDDTPGVQTYRTEWAATWMESYRNGGETRRTNENYGTNSLVQGFNSRYPGENWTSLAGFSGATTSSHDSELGLNFRDATSGAEILNVEIAVTGGGSLGADPRFFPEIHWASPTVIPPTYRRVPSTLMATPRVDPGWERVASIPPEFWPLLTTGDWNSIGLAKNPSALTRFNGWLEWRNAKPRIIVTYQK